MGKFCVLFYKDVSNSGCTASNSRCLESDELKVMLEEVVVA